MPGEIYAEPFQPKREAPCFCGSGNAFKACCGSVKYQRDPPHGVIVKRGWLPADRCDSLVADAAARPRGQLGVINSKQAVSERESLALDKSRVTQQVDLGDLLPDVSALVEIALVEVAEPAYSLKLEWFSQPQILYYEKGGHYHRHADAYNFDEATGRYRKVADREVSLLLYLNDEFEGGKIKFNHFNYRYQPGKGDLLLFPSDHRYTHQAEPVTAGNRYVVVSWAAQQGVPRVLDQPPEGAVMLQGV